MHRELASRSFTGHLLEMVSEQRIHPTVKTKVIEIMETLSREFKGDPSLRQMEDAFNSVKKQNPSFLPPAVPQKHQLTASERQKEEDDLQLALKLSLQDSQPPSFMSSGSSQQQQQAQFNKPSSSSHPTQPTDQTTKQTTQQSGSGSQKTATGKTASTVNRVRALYDLTSEDPNELSFRRGDIITVIESVYRDWWKGSLKGQVGIFPLNYVTPIPDPTPEEIELEAKDEAEVFAEAKNVEKLLAILSSTDSAPGSSNIAENEELQKLYHSTQAIRPRLVKLIEKYSQKRDDLIDLDKRFITARRTYDQLIDTSLSQIPINPPLPGQSQYSQATQFSAIQPQPQSQPQTQGQSQHNYPSSTQFNPSYQPALAPSATGSSQAPYSTTLNPTSSYQSYQQSQPQQPQQQQQSQQPIPQSMGGGSFLQPLQPEHANNNQYSQSSNTPGATAPPAYDAHQTAPHPQQQQQQHTGQSSAPFIVPAGTSLNQPYGQGNNPNY